MSKISLEDKVIIVTGGGRGLGRAMALGFARAGALGVTVTSSSSPDEITAVAREIDAIAGQGHGLAMRADVGKWAHCKKVVEQTAATFGALHILINNAARGPRYTSAQRGPFWEADAEGWRGVVDTNINGPFYMAKAAAPHLLAAKWGRIINISKTRDSMHAAKITPYGMSKAALEAATLSWAQDFAGTGVTVNSLAPGGPTDSGFETEDYWREAREAGHLRPADVMVEPALWLASTQSDAITGCRYIADRWDAGLPLAQAAEGAREPAIFIAPSKYSRQKKSGLTRTWLATGVAARAKAAKPAQPVRPAAKGKKP